MFCPEKIELLDTDAKPRLRRCRALEAQEHLFLEHKRAGDDFAPLPGDSLEDEEVLQRQV